VTVEASVDNWVSGFASTTVQDVDGTITIALPASGWEGQTFTNGGTVTLGGTDASNVVVSLTPSNPGDFVLPGTVTILAGQTSATFTVTLASDSVKQGTRTDTVTATTSGLTSGSANITVHDSNLDHLGFATIVGPETDAVAFSATLNAYNISNEIIPTFAATAVLSASGSGGSLPITPTSATFSSGVWSGNVTINGVDPAAKLQANASGVTGTSNSFVVQAGAVSTFQWSPVTSPQTQNLPISTTKTAKDVNGYTANFNGTTNLSGLVGGIPVSQTLLGNVLAPNESFNTGTFTIGYAFTPNTNIQVTAVRSYAGSKVEIWTDSGILLLSQAVSGPNGAWTETALATPLNLSAGTVYRIGTYTAGQEYYGRFDMGTASPLGTLGNGYEISGDAFPTTVNNWHYIYVDLRANIGSFTSVPIAPTTATFVNGVWAGNITVTQPETGMHLHIDDGSGHTADSNTFNVLARPTLTLPQAPLNLTYDATTDVDNWAVPVLNGIGGSPAPTGPVSLLYYMGSSASGPVLSSPPVNAGTYTLVASYGGDSNYGAAQSAPVTFIINKAPVVVMLPAPPATIAYDGTTDVLNWIQATVAGPATAPPPTGGTSYVYYAGSSATGTPLVSPPTAAGTYTVVAQYAGNSNYQAGSSAATTFTISAPVASLAVSFKVDDGTAQRSMIRSLTVAFTSAVTLQPGAITLTDNSGNPIPFAIATTDNATYTLTFSGNQFIGGSLANGRYILAVHASGVDAGGGPQLASDQTLSFWRLFGDFYGTATVNNADRALFTQVYKGQYAAYVQYFDYNGNGVLDSADTTAFGQDLGKSI
jgi:hypothetical protein